MTGAQLSRAEVPRSTCLPKSMGAVGTACVCEAASPEAVRSHAYRAALVRRRTRSRGRHRLRRQ